MKVDVRNLRQEITLHISGSEGWLKGIYDYFLTPAGQNQPLLKAEISIIPEASVEGFRLHGELAFAPFVDCSRCAIRIQWPIKESFEMFFVRKNNAIGLAEADLHEQDFGEYLLEGDEINLEEILNEQIQLAIPSQTIQISSEVKGSCLNCGKDVSSAQVYGSSIEDDPANPFAVLKNLKTPN